MPYPDADIDTIELFTFTVPGTVLVWRYSTHTASVTFGSNAYIPEAISRSNVTRTINQPSGDLTIDVGDENEFALKMFDGLTSRPIEVLVQQWQFGASTARTIFTGLTSGVSFDGPKATISCVPRYAVASRRKVPWQTFQAGCNWQLFSAGCTLDKASFVSGPYALASGAWSGAEVTITGTHADGDLSNGWIERVADGDRRFIEQNVGAVLTLQSQFPAVTNGESWLVYPGCRRTETECAGRYNNLAHFLGWSRLPAINPFSRGAFYLQGAATATPPSGTTADLGGGYSLDLSPAKSRIFIGSNYGNVGPVTVGLRFGMAGSCGMLLGTSGAISSPFAGRYISPRPCPPTVTSGLEIELTLGSLTSSSGDVTAASGVGFGSWVPLTSDVTGTMSATAGQAANPSGGARATVGAIYNVHVRIRRASTGIVLAEGDLSVGFSASVGAASSSSGGGLPGGW
jgi:hypothetical protein